jgi:hypothetical protein
VFVAPGLGVALADLPRVRRVDRAGDAEVVVADPAALAAGVAGGARAIAYLPMPPGYALVADGAFGWVALRAEAYASTAADLREALDLVLRDDAAARATGPLRVTYLGTLGQPGPVTMGPIGSSVPVTGSVPVGRAPGCAIVLRHGPHSDQNTVARRHAELAPAPGGVRVRCLGSTNGTWLDGARIAGEAIAAPGAELAFACTHRFRVDGGDSD